MKHFSTTKIIWAYDMICKFIQKFGLFIFWNCLDEETRQKTIKEHRYTKMNINHIDNVAKKAEDFEQEYLSLSKKIIDLKNKVEHIKDVEHIKSELNSLVEEIKANV